MGYLLSLMCLPIPPYPRYIKTIAGFEPANSGFAVHRLRPTWLYRQF